MDRHPALVTAAEAALAAWQEARTRGDRDWLLETVREGADGTPTSRLDDLVETEILRAVEAIPVNILSEELGWRDGGHGETLVMDPVDGTGNAAAGLPFSAFTGAIARDDRFVEGLTIWLDTERSWWAHVDTPTAMSTSRRQSLEGAFVSMIRPKRDATSFLAIAHQAERTRVLGSSSIEAALVADGSLDASVDPGSRTHRIVDLAAAVVLVGAAGGSVVDLHGMPLTFTTEITGRWSGVVAASPALACEIVDLIGG